MARVKTLKLTHDQDRLAVCWAAVSVFAIWMNAAEAVIRAALSALH